MERSDARKRRTEDQWTHWDAAVRELIREHSARAWDEGHQAAGDALAADIDAIANGHAFPPRPANPYREAS